MVDKGSKGSLTADERAAMAELTRERKRGTANVEADAVRGSEHRSAGEEGDHLGAVTRIHCPQEDAD